MDIILASASPRRQELLKNIFTDFSVIPADIDENIGGNTEVENLPEAVAIKKAKHVAKNYPDSLVIGCDTGVIVDNLMLGKPKDKQDAVNMLKMLSGSKHFVITGCCLCYKGKVFSFSEKTVVEFYHLTDSEILEYTLAAEQKSSVKYEWQDKAGGYGIQGKAGLFVKGIEGDYYNVVGLPYSRLNREIKKFLKEV